MTYAAAFALALSGDRARSRELADDLERRFPEDTSVQFSYRPALRALFSANAGQPEAAIQLLQAPARFDLAVAGVAMKGFYGALYSVYVRGQGYLAAGRPAEAATEFRRILSHRGIVLVDPVDAMARLQLARALALSGDTANAKTAYQDFLDLWNAADHDALLLAQARRETGRLKSDYGDYAPERVSGCPAALRIVRSFSDAAPAGWTRPRARRSPGRRAALPDGAGSRMRR